MEEEAGGLSGRVDSTCTLCPRVHVYDGERWRYETTLGGTMLVDHAEQLGAGAGKRVRIIPLWVRLDRAQLGPEGSLRARIVASEDGIVYVDHVALAAIFHPPEHEVVSSSVMQWRVLENRRRERFWAFPTPACRVAEGARWCGELDVRGELSEATGVAAHHALDRNNYYDLDFGEVHDRRHPWLLIDGWTFKRPRGLSPSERGHEPALEIRQADGSYRRVRVLVAQRGDRKSSAVSLRGLDWPTGRYELRLWTGTGDAGHAMWCLDRLRLVETTPAPLSITKLGVRGAELRAPEPPSPGPRTYGRFTRCGEVTPLLRGPDEHMVVMRQGDALELEFGPLPAPPPGLESSWFLGAQLVYKARVVPGADGPCVLTEQVAPMPRRYMGRYDQDAVAHTHGEFVDYLARWNTREHIREERS